MTREQEIKDAEDYVERYIAEHVFIPIEYLNFKKLKFTEEEIDRFLNSNRWDIVTLRGFDGNVFDALLTKNTIGVESVKKFYEVEYGSYAKSF